VLISEFLRRFTSVFLLLAFLFPSSISAYELSPTESELLKKIERDSIQYFTRMSDKTTGLTRDNSRSGSPASIAATGFSLAALAIGQDQGWLNKDQTRAQIEKTLKTLLNKAEHKNGFFYHFLDNRTGRRVWGSESSSIDTALLIAGALVAAQYYPGTDIDHMVHQIYDRVDWRWMMNGSDFVCMGWRPETGFLPYYWDSYNELMIMLALAIGSPTHPVPIKAWERWMRPVDEYNGHRVIHSGSGSLFTYQFAQAFIDFRGLDDNGINYFENSKEATKANRDYSLSFRDQFLAYREDSWGLSASVGPGGYKAYGGKPGGGEQDGTIAPYAALSAIVFTPEESIAAAKYFYENHAERLYGIFGFKDAFNLNKAWCADEYLGIDQGITVLMLENFLNDGIIWKKFMAVPEIELWLEKSKLVSKQAKLAEPSVEAAKISTEKETGV
jgi:hypothetical protein